MKTLLLLAFLGLAAAYSHEDVDRIMGGRTCSKHSVPWIASLITTHHVCGGSLIAPNWVLTAAHCKESGLMVRLGEHDISRWEGTEQVISVAEVFVHQDYDEVTLDNDIMLIKLARPANINGYVNTIGLSQHCPQPHDKCDIAGWGLTMNEHIDSNILQCVNIEVMKQYECQRAYPGLITDNMMCVGDFTGEKDSCEGDSGGPAVCNGVLQGIVSWGYRCGMKNYPGVYTRVCKYFDWINKTMSV